jgi:hypothetical protein
MIMMRPDTCQSRRFEWKYVIDEPRAGAIRDYLRGHLVADSHMPAGGHGYPVHSLYLDTPAWQLYRQTVEGQRNRFKLRIRYYDHSPSSPVFLEIKRRSNEVILKQRAAVTREGVGRMLRGQYVDDTHLASGGDTFSGMRALHEFRRLTRSLGARASVLVSYTREAYTLPDSDNVRVTFDRLVAAGFYRADGHHSPAWERARPRLGDVILEVKFTDSFPRWLSDLTRSFNLSRRSVPKYVACTQALFRNSSPRAGVL